MLVSKVMNRQLGAKGRAIYEAKLKAILEPDHALASRIFPSDGYKES